MKSNRDTTGPGDQRFPSNPSSGAANEGAMEYSLEELAEFLEADLVDIEVDPEFKQSLREKLWNLVQTRNRLRGRGPDRT